MLINGRSIPVVAFDHHRANEGALIMSPERVRPVDAAVGMSTPRRLVLRALSAGSAAVLGGLGLSGAAPARKARGEKKKKKSGKAGPPGPPGPAGPQGPAAGVSIVLGPEVVFSVPEGSVEVGRGACPGGATALGPSYFLNNSGCHVSMSNPFGATAWEVEVRCPAGQSSPDNTMRAVCLQVAGSS
jgi:hypothetical protein